MYCVKKGEFGVFFIDDFGGIGKIFLYCVFYVKIRLMGKIVFLIVILGDCFY